MFTKLFEILLLIKVSQIVFKIIFNIYDINDNDNDIKCIGALMMMRFFNSYVIYKQLCYI